MAFNGYLFKVLGSKPEKFPLKYIAIETWKSTPNQREELKAYRDDNSRDLHRITAHGKKSIFSFSTRSNLHLKDVKAIMDLFTSNEVNKEERKVQIEFWDNENFNYKTGYFYRPNMEFPIKQIIKTKDGKYDIIYGELSLEFIEY